MVLRKKKEESEAEDARTGLLGVGAAKTGGVPSKGIR